MKKNLPTIRQSTEVALSRANTLMDVADKILAKQSTDLLAKQSTDLVDESWMEVLWQWADDNRIQSYQLPRNRDGLLNLTELYLNANKLTELPKEIGNLVNLTKLDLGSNPFTELPKEIGNLVNLIHLDLSCNKLTELPKEITNLVSLRWSLLTAKTKPNKPYEPDPFFGDFIGYKEQPLPSLTTAQQAWFDNIEYTEI